MPFRSKMSSKRRDNGLSKSPSGHAEKINCDYCSSIARKEKAIKKFQIRYLIDAASKEDIAKASTCMTPIDVLDLLIKMYYSVSCAIHAKIFAMRSILE